MLETYFDKYDDLSNVKRSKIDHKYDSANLTLGEYDYSQWYKEKKLDDLPLLEGDEEELKEGKTFKIVTPKKLLTRLAILLAQLKAGNNSIKLKNEIRQILHLLYQHNKITKKLHNNFIKSL